MAGYRTGIRKKVKKISPRNGLGMISLIARVGQGETRLHSSVPGILV
jgi:hypothetical protein